MWVGCWDDAGLEIVCRTYIIARGVGMRRSSLVCLVAIFVVMFVSFVILYCAECVAITACNVMGTQCHPMQDSICKVRKVHEVYSCRERWEFPLEEVMDELVFWNRVSLCCHSLALLLCTGARGDAI